MVGRGLEKGKGVQECGGVGMCEAGAGGRRGSSPRSRKPAHLHLQHNLQCPSSPCWASDTCPGKFFPSLSAHLTNPRPLRVQLRSKIFKLSHAVLSISNFSWNVEAQGNPQKAT